MSAKQRQGHASDEELIRLIDGELDRANRAYVEPHIAACWGCRHRHEEFLRVMGRFTEFEMELVAAEGAQPPSNWKSFESRLRRAAMVPPPAPRSQNRGLVLGAAAAAVIAVWLWPARPLSAKDVLHRSSQVETAAMQSVRDRVVLQRVRVESRQRRAEGAFWNVPVSSRSHHNWVTSGEGIAGEVEGVYARHGLDFRRPVSVANHQAWRERLLQREEEVQEDGQYLRIRTRNGGAVVRGRIQEAELVVRTSDWHAVEQTLTLAGEEEPYRISEVGYEVKPMTTELARIFAAEPSAAATVLPGAPTVPGVAAAVIPEWVVPQPAPLPDLRALAAAEVEALAIVHELEADRREAAKVELEPQQVAVTLYASDPQRAQLLQSRLSMVPNLQLRLYSLDAAESEAAAAGVEIAPESTEQPLFLRELVSATGSLQAANIVISHQSDLLRRLKSASRSLADLAARFPANRQQDFPEAAQLRLRALQQSYFDSARQVWNQWKDASPMLFRAMGAPLTSVDAASACVWPQTAADLQFGARRLEELHFRAFTSVAGADTALRWMSRGALREETAALYAALDHSFADHCRP